MSGVKTGTLEAPIPGNPGIAELEGLPNNNTKGPSSSGSVVGDVSDSSPPSLKNRKSKPYRKQLTQRRRAIIRNFLGEALANPGLFGKANSESWFGHLKRLLKVHPGQVEMVSTSDLIRWLNNSEFKGRYEILKNQDDIANDTGDQSPVSVPDDHEVEVSQAEMDPPVPAMPQPAPPQQTVETQLENIRNFISSSLVVDPAYGVILRLPPVPTLTNFVICSAPGWAVVNLHGSVTQTGNENAAVAAQDEGRAEDENFMDTAPNGSASSDEEPFNPADFLQLEGNSGEQNNHNADF